MITALARSSNGSTELIPSRLFLVTAPTTEPLTISEVKQHLRINSATGEPAPTAPTVTLVTAAGNINSGVHRWLWVFRTADGQTDAGAVSVPLTTATATQGQATVTKPVGGSAVTYCDLYRTAANASSYLLVAATANDGATYTDNIADGSLGAGAPTTNTTADPELVSWLTAARMLVESDPSADGTSGGTGRALITQTYDLKLDGFPWGYLSALAQLNYQYHFHERQYLGGSGMRPILIPKPPLVSVTSVKYIDTDGVEQTWSNTLYTVDAPTGDYAEPGRIFPVYGQVYPVTRSQPAAVTIRFVAGYGAASAVPAPIKAAVKLLIGVWYESREAGVIIRGSSDVIPFGVDSLLQPFRVM